MSNTRNDLHLYLFQESSHRTNTGQDRDLSKIPALHCTNWSTFCSKVSGTNVTALDANWWGKSQCVHFCISFSRLWCQFEAFSGSFIGSFSWPERFAEVQCRSDHALKRKMMTSERLIVHSRKANWLKKFFGAFLHSQPSLCCSDLCCLLIGEGPVMLQAQALVEIGVALGGQKSNKHSWCSPPC